MPLFPHLLVLEAAGVVLAREEAVAVGDGCRLHDGRRRWKGRGRGLAWG